MYPREAHKLSDGICSPNSEPQNLYFLNANAKPLIVSGSEHLVCGATTFCPDIVEYLHTVHQEREYSGNDNR